MKPEVLLVVLAVAACDRDPEKTPRSYPRMMPEKSARAAAASAPPSASLPVTAWTKTLSEGMRPTHAQLTASLRKGLPDESSDYAEALALVMMHGRGDIDFDALKKAVVARALRRHRLGDAHLMQKPPPPGQTSDPAIMPDDWANTWGEMAMAYLLGELTEAQYEALHAAAHPSCS